MKLFIVPDKGEGVYHLLTEEGEHLASHFCSHQAYAKGDLEASRPERQEKWSARFGDYEVMFLSEQDEVSMDELIKRNKHWHEESKKSKVQ